MLTDQRGTATAMAKPPVFHTFREFWPFYVGEHANATNRVLHFCGTTLVLTFAALAIALRKPWLLALMPVGGYGFAWVGHFIVEKNRPATFTYPLWSLAGDFLMYWKTLTGQMAQEVRAATAPRSS